MALRHNKQDETTGAQLLPFRTRAERVETRRDEPSPLVPKEETVMRQSLPDHRQPADRRLRNMIILANAFAWILIAMALRYALS